MTLNCKSMLTAAAICLAALPVASSAQTGSTAKKDLAARVILAQQDSIDSIARNIANQTAQQVLDVTGQALLQVPADKREAIGKDVEADIKRFHDDMEQILHERAARVAPAAMSPILEDRFTEDELKQLATWLESSAARKFTQVGPDLSNALQQQLVADTRSAVEPKLRALEETLRKKLGVDQAAPPAAAASAPSASKSPAKTSGKPSSKAASKNRNKK